jgi:hypothetical protein
MADFDQYGPVAPEKQNTEYKIGHEMKKFIEQKSLGNKVR